MKKLDFFFCDSLKKQNKKTKTAGSSDCLSPSMCVLNLLEYARLVAVSAAGWGVGRDEGAELLLPALRPCSGHRLSFSRSLFPQDSFARSRFSFENAFTRLALFLFSFIFIFCDAIDSIFLCCTL